MLKTGILTSSKDTENLLKFLFRQEGLTLDTLTVDNLTSLNYYQLVLADENLYQDSDFLTNAVNSEIIVLILNKTVQNSFTAPNITGFLHLPASAENISNIIQEIKQKYIIKSSGRKEFRYEINKNANLWLNNKDYNCIIEDISKGGFKTSLSQTPEDFHNLESALIKLKTEENDIYENFKVRWKNKNNEDIVIGGEWENLSEIGEKNIINLLLNIRII